MAIPVGVSEKKQPELRAQIQKAVEDHFFNTVDWAGSWESQLAGSIEVSTNSNNTPDIQAEALRDLIWETAGEFVEISVRWYCLEVEPDDEQNYDEEDDYLEWLGGLKALAQQADG